MTSAERVNEIERWFVGRDVPHPAAIDNGPSIFDTRNGAFALLVTAGRDAVTP